MIKVIGDNLVNTSTVKCKFNYGAGAAFPGDSLFPEGGNVAYVLITYHDVVRIYFNSFLFDHDHF